MTQIRREIENTDSDYDREKLQERLAKLAGGVAVIKAGAATEVELKERKHRIEDAVRNAKAAVEEGIVAGGGVALIQAGKIAFDERSSSRATRRPVRTSCASPSRLRSSRSRSTRAWSPASSRTGCAELPVGSRPERRDRRVRRHVRAGHHRPGQGHPLRAAERRVDRGLFLTTEAVVADKPEKVGAPAGDPTGGMDF